MTRISSYRLTYALNAIKRLTADGHYILHQREAVQEKYISRNLVYLQFQPIGGRPGNEGGDRTNQGETPQTYNLHRALAFLSSSRAAHQRLVHVIDHLNSAKVSK